jgi:undecaprenyl-diphosphatase
MELQFLDCIKGFFLGIVQGLTEFLPVSSSGHLVLFKTILDYAPESGALTEVLLHLGTFLSLLVVFRKDIIEMLAGMAAFLGSLFKKDGSESVKTTPPQKMIVLIIISIIPLFIMVPFKDSIESLYEKPVVVGFALILTAVLLFLADRAKKGNKDIYTATPLDALIVGIAQAFAVTPGLSRSGTTISVGLFRGFSRRFAVRFSFLMSLPAVLGSVILVVRDAFTQGAEAAVVVPGLIGMVSAFISGLFAIKMVSWLVSHEKFGGFAYYCGLIGLVVIIVNLVR